MSATWVTFLFEAANFLLLAALLGWLFFRPVRDAIEKRRGDLEADRNEAAKARADAERALGEARAQRAELEHSFESLRERVTREAEAERERVVESAREQMQRERETLKEELVSLRRAQTRSLARDAAFAARQIVRALLEEMQGPELEGSMIRKACRELERLRASGSLAPIVIESARALDEVDREALAGAAGVTPAETRQRVDAELVAGVRILTARGLVDVSVAGLAGQVERMLVGRLDRENSDHG